MTDFPNRGREIPWLQVVRFHKEIVARAEQGFFSLNGRDAQAERWTSLSAWEPDEIAGPWHLPVISLVSQSFKIALEQKQHESLYLGGPCYLAWVKGTDGKWLGQWRPTFFREVEIRANENRFDLVPKEGGWSLSPLLFEMLERLEVNVAESADVLAGRIVEKAAITRKHQGTAWSIGLLNALASVVPEVGSELTKQMNHQTFPVAPSPWVLFAPTTTFGAFTRNLMRDYERLEKLLLADATNIGGLRLLEDRRFPDDPSISEDVLPLVPLNEHQREAVTAILSGRPLTAISGPPGTGKSQVVVSLLLNAWAKGKTVLFASNNNKAVDVVRERIERFESKVPIVVRAGNQQKQNICDNLRRTLALVSQVGKAAPAPDSTDAGKRRRTLEFERDTLQGALRSDLPQRIDEARATAFRGYAEFRTILARLTDFESQLRQQLQNLGFDPRQPDAARDAAIVTGRWLTAIANAMVKVKDDASRKAALMKEVEILEKRRDSAVASIGLAPGEIRNWNWLLSGPNPRSVGDWDTRLRQYLLKPIEQSLGEIEWRAEYDRWRSDREASAWAIDARAFTERVERALAELAPRLSSIRRVQQALKEEQSKLDAAGITSVVDISAASLREWAGAFAERTTAEKRRIDFLPWSRRAQLDKKMRAMETKMRPAFPLSMWARVGTLDSQGRIKLAPIVECSYGWLEEKERWDALQGEIQAIDDTFLSMRSDAAGLRLNEIPQSQESEAWLPLVKTCQSDVYLAEEAARQWQAKIEKAGIEKKLRGIASEWQALANGVPIWETWRSKAGTQFDAAVRSLAEFPSVEAVTRVRASMYEGGTSQLLECWNTAVNSEEQTILLREKLKTVPTLQERQEEWWRARPSEVFFLDRPADGWPNTGEATEAVGRVIEWHKQWQEFITSTKPAQLSVSEQELARALTKLEQAVGLLPIGEVRGWLEQLISAMVKNKSQDWPLENLNSKFGAFSPRQIRSRIEGIESELERHAFDESKASWINRLRNDKTTQRAIDDLEKVMNGNRNQVPESAYATFRQALNGIPVWVVNANSTQAIPLEPDLYDIVVVDEASQCTLTNFLPLIYRGKTLAVIGDGNQLPAIPTIQDTDELVLANKYEVEAHLPVIGHTSNDVYKTATESLPGRRADVLMLTEHFRSHPQIIGFSNRYIYLQRLELKKDPSWGQRLPVGSGMHLRHVSGSAAKGDNGRSWINRTEALAVVALVKELRSGDSRGLSLGVVTPFAAQKDFLRQQIDALQLASEVVVDTAFGFQGDERDVMIFSPVVARGITPAASRWVETPPNLINVAITRAKEALFLVGDVDYWCQQEGILRKLGLYCKDIKLLRDTSPAELELFSWMVVRGWEPQVHPRIGDLEVDFVLRAPGGERIVIEVDGHQHKDATEQDRARDAFLVGQNYRVLRVQARDVLETPFDVIHRIDVLLGKK